ncbi:MAG: 4-(cytidine 5'-diphospho)-2-C-methyl-D-erythritol kinase [Opitutaceae bacterium]
MSPPSILASAKLNLFLAVTERRPDGFHDLVSLVVRLDFGDFLSVRVQEDGEGKFSMECDDPDLPVDETNLVTRAARSFAKAANWNGSVHFRLQKRIPLGAGLGGGSSDAVAALGELNRQTGKPLAAAPMVEVAAQLGSDCPLFLRDGPVIMRGRGERVEALAAGAAARLRGRRVLIFKPAFGVATPWAYAQMVAQPDTYVPAPEAEARLARWISDESRPVEELLFNNMEFEVFKKYPALPILLRRLRSEYGLVGRMSGSGSGCFAFLPHEVKSEPIVETIRDAWGKSAFVVEACVL